MHLLDLAAKVKGKAWWAAGSWLGMRFNYHRCQRTVFSHGNRRNEFLRFNPATLLQTPSENDDGAAQWYDANISLPGLRQRTCPAAILAMGRLNRPSLGGFTAAPFMPAMLDARKLDVISAFQSYGEFISGRKYRTKARRKQIVQLACPGAGGMRWYVHGQLPMASAIEMLGHCRLPYSSSTPC